LVVDGSDYPLRCHQRPERERERSSRRHQFSRLETAAFFGHRPDRRVHHANYSLSNAWDYARRRLTLLEQYLDPITHRRPSSLGLGKGWDCLEVGGGGIGRALAICSCRSGWDRRGWWEAVIRSSPLPRVRHKQKVMGLRLPTLRWLKQTAWPSGSVFSLLHSYDALISPLGNSKKPFK
jgi:hypothetical protein